MKADVFKVGKPKRHDAGDSSSSSKLKLRKTAADADEYDAATYARARRKMEEKARLYAAMKRGDYVPPSGSSRDVNVLGDNGPLVDFDRKWAEEHAEGRDVATSSGSDDDGYSSEDNAPVATGKDKEAKEEELVDYEDEFGRTRRVTRRELARLQRMRRVQDQDDDPSSARPAAPSVLIRGDTIQAAAFAPTDDMAARMAELAASRDRPPTPPPAMHYDASAEVRNRGTGFYKFSKTDEDARRREMEALEAERKETERIRAEREMERERRKKELEERRRLISERRSKKLAEGFLGELEKDLLAGSYVGGDGDAGAASTAGTKSKDGDSTETKEPS